MLPIPVAAVPAPAPSAVAGLPACGAADLSLSFDGEDGAFDGMQHGGTLMVVRNIGAAPCRVAALPRLSFLGVDGSALPIRFRPPPGLHPGPALLPVGIAPGAEVTAELRWIQGDAFAGGRCYRTAAVRVAFDAGALQASFERQMCGPAEGATYDQGWLRPNARLKP